MYAFYPPQAGAGGFTLVNPAQFIPKEAGISFLIFEFMQLEFVCHSMLVICNFTLWDFYPRPCCYPTPTRRIQVPPYFLLLTPDPSFLTLSPLFFAKSRSLLQTFPCICPKLFTHFPTLRPNFCKFQIDFCKFLQVFQRFRSFPAPPPSFFAQYQG